MLDESETSTQAQHEIRAQRESELAALKKSLEDERSEHETSVSSMRQKHSRKLEELNDQIDAIKKVSCQFCDKQLTSPLLSQAKSGLEKAKAHLEADRQSLVADLKDSNAALAESEKRRRGVEAQLSESQSRIAEDTAKIQDLTSQNDRMKVRVVCIEKELDNCLALSSTTCTSTCDNY